MNRWEFGHQSVRRRCRDAHHLHSEALSLTQLPQLSVAVELGSGQELAGRVKGRDPELVTAPGSDSGPDLLAGSYAPLLDRAIRVRGHEDFAVWGERDS